MSLCENTASTVIFAHVRAASPGTAITAWNAHPFRFGRYIFMHNGGLAFFDQIKRSMCAEISTEAFNEIKGTADSEHLAALTFTILEKKKGPRAWEESHPVEELRRALEDAIKQVIVLQIQVSTPDTFQASSINVAITDGHQLLAIRFRNHLKEHPPSLYTSRTAGTLLNRKFEGNPNNSGPNLFQKKFPNLQLKAPSLHKPHVVVCSEPTTYDERDWKLVPKNTGIMVDEDMRVEEFEVDVQF